MPRFRFKLRTISIAVAVIATLLGIAVGLVREVNRGLFEYYGPGGYLERRGVDRIPGTGYGPGLDSGDRPDRV